MNETYAVFAQRLREHCRAHSLSQADVARKFGHSGTIVNHYFAGRHAPIEKDEADLASAIGVSRNTLGEWLGRDPIRSADVDDIERMMIEIRSLVDRMTPDRRRAVVTIAREIAQL